MVKPDDPSMWRKNLFAITSEKRRLVGGFEPVSACFLVINAMFPLSCNMRIQHFLMFDELLENIYFENCSKFSHSAIMDTVVMAEVIGCR